MAVAPENRVLSFGVFKWSSYSSTYLPEWVNTHIYIHIHMLSGPGERVIRRFVLASTCVCASVPFSAASPELANEASWGALVFNTRGARHIITRTVNILHTRKSPPMYYVMQLLWLFFFLHIYSWWSSIRYRIYIYIIFFKAYCCKRTFTCWMMCGLSAPCCLVWISHVTSGHPVCTKTTCPAATGFSFSYRHHIAPVHTTG